MNHHHGPSSMQSLFEAARTCTGELIPENWEWVGRAHLNGACRCPSPDEPRTYCNLTWIQPPGHAPALALSESGDSLTLTTMFGVIHYSRNRDSDNLAAYLEQVARIVREHS